MFLNKLWFILVALVAAVALTVAFVAPRSAGRQLANTEALGLDRAQYAAEQMLKLDARRWIDYVAKLGRDAKITEALESATRAAGEDRVLHETVRGRLGSLVADPAGIGIYVLGAVDASGRVLARIGAGENDYGESFRGLDVISDALAGYLSDSVWARDGRLVRVAAAPVLAKTRDRIVGAIFVGVENGERLAEIWKRNLGVEVAFLLGGQVTNATIPEAALNGIFQRIADRAEEIATMRRTRAFALSFGRDEYSAVVAPFTGEAETLGGYYVLLQQRKTSEDPFALLANTTKNDLSWEEFPWLKLGSAVLIMLAVGLLLQNKEVEAPLRTLRAQMQKLARGEINKLDDSKHPGRFGGIARDVNASLERAAGHALSAAQAPGDKRDLNKILGDDLNRERAASLPPLPPLGGPASGWGAGRPFGAPMSPGAFGAAPTSAPGFAPNLGSGPLGTGFGAAPGSGPSLAPAFVQQPSPPGYPSPTTQSVGMQSPSVLPPSGLGSVPSAHLTSPPLPAPPVVRPPAPAMATTTPVATPPPPAAASPMARTTPGAPPAREMDDLPTKDMAQDKGGGESEWDRHVREVFAEYVSTRARCGEPTQGLALDKFREKLEANRKAIIEKYNSTGARFSVYVKDGKAALKASPSK